MQNLEKTKQDLISKHTKTAAHHGKSTEKKVNELSELIDCEVPGDSYYTQFANDEKEQLQTVQQPDALT